MKEQISSSDTQNKIILYTTADGKVTADVFFANDTFWLTQRTMAELFGINIPSVSRHLKNIYASQELSLEATVSKIETVQMEGQRQVTRAIEVYNLDAAIAVGYRVSSLKATHYGKVLKSDTIIAKNYLNQDEVSKLDRLVNMFIDFAELRALNRQVMAMKDWLKQVEKFLNYTDQQILRHAGQISHDMAIAKAGEEYEKYRIHQNREYVSDFDRAYMKYLKGGDEPNNQ